MSLLPGLCPALLGWFRAESVRGMCRVADVCIVCVFRRNSFVHQQSELFAVSLRYLPFRTLSCILLCVSELCVCPNSCSVGHVCYLSGWHEGRLLSKPVCVAVFTLCVCLVCLVPILCQHRHGVKSKFSQVLCSGNICMCT